MRIPTISARTRWSLGRYGGAVLAVVLATAVRAWLDSSLGETAAFSTYYVAILATAAYGGIGPSLLVLVTGALAADYFFIAPRGSIFFWDWVNYSLVHQVDLLLYFLVGSVTALLSESLRRGRRRTEAARAALAEANRALQEEIADRRRAEQWLLESEQRFRGYFEQGLVGMGMLAPDQTWLEVNERLCHMLRLSEPELSSRNWIDLACPDDREAEECRFGRMIGGQSKGYSMERRLLRSDRTVLTATVCTQCLRKEDGTVDCILVMVQDHSSQKDGENITGRSEPRLMAESS